VSRNKQPWVAHHRMDAQRELPWVPIGKEYRFDTEDGSRTLRELFAGRSQLIVYHFMFGPTYTAGCPVCSSAADTFNGAAPQLNARDVTFSCISRAPLERLQAYKRRMGWTSHGPPRTESTTTSTSRSHARRRRRANSWPAASPRWPPSLRRSAGPRRRHTFPSHR